MKPMNVGIRARVLLLTLVPLLALGLTLGPYAVITRMNELDTALQERGETIVRHLVSASEAGLAASDAARLSMLATAAAANADVDEVIILTADHRVVARASGDGTPAPQDLAITFSSPVMRTTARLSPEEIPQGNALPASLDGDTIGWIELRMSRENTLARRHSTISNIALLTACAGTLSLLIALWMGRGIVRPIIRLRDAVDGIRKGRLETRVLSTTGGELGALEHGFNDMAEVMERSQTRLQREIGVATRRLRHTIEALEHQNRELEEARQKALAASREKANFLANMSHEIRTPLNAILGYTSLLGRSGLTSEQHEHARTISCASRQLMRVIDDILSFSKLESGTVELDLREFDLRDAFEDVLAMMAPEARDKHLELVLIIDSDIPARMRGDPVRIGQVVINLLSNAIKFTEHGGVTVHVLLAGTEAGCAEIEVRVSDSGIGIESEALERIFGSFQQADASISRRYGGAGLGLAIVSRLVKLWGGQVGVSSEPGKGSTFWFRFGGEVAEPPAERVVDPILAGRKVLLYDDNPAALRAVRTLLLGWQVRVFVARRREALEPMLASARESSDPYEVVILGMDLSHDAREEDSRGLLDVIRSRHRVPLMLMVNCKQTCLLSRSLSDEGVKIVVKPLRRDIVHRNLCGLLGLRNTPTHPDVSTAVFQQGEFAGLRILLAEDNEFNRTLITHILEAAGIAVAPAANGDQALALARERDFDLVMMDLHLPGMDGVETARRLRELRPELRDMVIVALTADVFFDEPAKLRAAGMDACLLKPIDEAKLWRTLRGLQTGTPGNGQKAHRAAISGASSTEIRRLLKPRLLSSIRQHRARIAEAMSRLDRVALNDLVHELKGVVGYFGLQELTQAVAMLERAVDEDADAEELRRLFGVIDQLVERTTEAEPASEEAAQPC